MNTKELIEILSGHTGHAHYGMAGYNGAPTYRKENGQREIVPGCGYTWTDAYAYTNPQSGEVVGDKEKLVAFLVNVPIGFEIQWHQYYGCNWDGCYTFKKRSENRWKDKYDEAVD